MELSPPPNYGTHIVLGFQSQCFGIRLFHHDSRGSTVGMDSESSAAVASPPCPPSGSGYMAPDDLDSRGALFSPHVQRYQRKQKTPTFRPVEVFHAAETAIDLRQEGELGLPKT